MSDAHLDAFKTINLIFTAEPKEPNTLNLRLDPNDPNNANVNIYDILINVYLNGMITLFGNQVNPGNVNKDQYDILNKYMASLGYYANYERKTNEHGVPTHVEITFSDYKDQYIFEGACYPHTILQKSKPIVELKPSPEPVVAEPVELDVQEVKETEGDGQGPNGYLDETEEPILSKLQRCEKPGDKLK